ncbi:hypothetical protein BDZ89DRAFT_1079456 [Hymenopellis radicata]|nr:hypothetical protein BDZ89DRAFT_1079456 [Hymenopellis radicata]
MSIRFRPIAAVALCLLLPTFTFMFHLVLGFFEPYGSLLYRIVHPINLLIILTLLWFYETPLETVQEVARLGNGRWARQMAALKPDGSQPRADTGEYNLTDYSFYQKTGTWICVALAQWVFWLWFVFPVKYFFLTIPPALAGAIHVWRSRMSILGPTYQFACDREIEDMEDAIKNGEPHCPRCFGSISAHKQNNESTLYSEWVMVAGDDL